MDLLECLVVRFPSLRRAQLPAAHGGSSLPTRILPLLVTALALFLPPSLSLSLSFLSHNVYTHFSFAEIQVTYVRIHRARVHVYTRRRKSGGGEYIVDAVAGQ